MTRSLCLNCGEFKFGAFLGCPYCGEMPKHLYLSLILNNGFLGRNKLRAISRAISSIYQTGENEKVRYYTLLYYLRHEWSWIPILDFSALKPDEREQIENLYNSILGCLQDDDAIEP